MIMWCARTTSVYVFSLNMLAGYLHPVRIQPFLHISPLLVISRGYALPLPLPPSPSQTYLPVCRQYGSMPVFLKIQTHSFQKVWKWRHERCEFVASEADRRALMGSYRSLTFAYFKPFSGLKYTACPDWSKKFVKPMNIDFASKLYGSWPFSDMAGLKLSAISGCMKPTKRRKNPRNQGNKLRPNNKRSRKDMLASAKAAHSVHCFWRMCSTVFNQELLSQM